MRKFFKILMWFVLLIVLLVIVLVGYVQLGWNKTYQAPYPEISASTAPAMIERGEYLAYGPSHCASCHVPMDKVMAEWDEAFFIDRFKGGRLHKGSPMPWGLYSKMDDTDLKALYRYLHSLEPVENKIRKTVYLPGETMPE